jgi:pimeloyl-ACP methyl ester carboxylesterase
VVVPALRAILKFAGSPLERRLLFEPTVYPDGDWNPSGLDVEDVHFPAADGARLHGWYCTHPGARAVVLWCHGNAGNLSHRATSIRGAYDWLRGSRGAPPERIILLGRSLGGAVAAQLALEREHRSLILQSTFTSVSDMARHIFRLPLGWLVRNRFETVQKLPVYHAPLLVTHGTRDEMIPFHMGRRLFECAAGPKTFYAVPDGGHADMESVGGREYFQTLARFIETSAAAKQVPATAAEACADGASVGGLAFDI